ncbi:MAG: hypothetical protein GEU79_16775 [Acidimicrobiia bacterium]|nr:hypothetical protein [Acidimicrobiia bacterium]
MADIEKQIAGLYAEPLDQFTAARNDLAAQVKKDGDKEAAERVKALKKPSVSVWVVNQLVRTRELDLKRLLQAGERVEKAQKAMLAGKKAKFEDARNDQRVAVRAMRSAATEILPNISASVLERVARSLEAASSAEGRDQLKDGLLTQDLEPPGFEILAGLGAAPSKPKTDKPNPKLDALEESLKTAKETLKTAESEAKQLEVAAAKAVKAAEAARKKADKAAADLQKIEEALTKAKKR